MDDTTRATHVDNDLTRALSDVLARCAHGEPDYFIEIAADMVRVDHRRAASGLSYGGTEFDETVGEYYHAFGLVRISPLAVRGQHLALVRLIATVDNHEFQLLSVYESDASGRLVRCAMFDDADIEAASEELENRYRTMLLAQAELTSVQARFESVPSS